MATGRPLIGVDIVLNKIQEYLKKKIIYCNDSELYSLIIEGENLYQKEVFNS